MIVRVCEVLLQVQKCDIGTRASLVRQGVIILAQFVELLLEPMKTWNF